MFIKAGDLEKAKVYIRFVSYNIKLMTIEYKIIS